MKQLIRRLSRVADSSLPSPAESYSLLRSDSSSRGRKSVTLMRRRSSKTVPSGHVPVYVGEEMERFVVRADLVNHPIFVKLLNKSAQEYGYAQKGALRIPACNVVVFERLLQALRRGNGEVSIDVHDLVNSLGISFDEQLFV